MTIHAPDPISQALKSDDDYPRETKTIRVKTVPSLSKRWSALFCTKMVAPIFKNREPYALENFTNPLFPVSRVCMTPVMIIHV